jgi:hypothetical protein
MEQDCSGRCGLLITAIKPVASPGSFPQTTWLLFSTGRGLCPECELVDGSTELV